MRMNVRSKNAVALMMLISIGAVVTAVALPQVFHLLGGWLGVQTALGEMFLPMHLPVMAAGLLAGPLAGVAVGIASPLISFWLTGMPLMTMLPFMTVELAVYGLVAGYVCNVKMPVVAKVALIQVAGRAARAAVLLIATYGFGVTAPPLSIIWTSISAGAVGILLQLVLIPLLVRAVRR